MRFILRLIPIVALLMVNLRASGGASAGPALSLTVAHSHVRPGQQQTAVVIGVPNTRTTLLLTMPNGRTLKLNGVTSRVGRLRFRFSQPFNVLGRHSRVARVRAMQDGGAAPVSARYTVAFAPIDLVTPGKPVRENGAVVLWIHSRPRRVVQARVMPYRQTTRGRTGAQGWFHFQIQASNASPESLVVSVRARLLAVHSSTRTTFTVKPYPFKAELSGAQVLHLSGGLWVPTDQIHLGEDFRVAGFGFINEPAGNFGTFVRGTVTIMRGDAAVASGTLQSETGPDYNEYATFRLTDAADVGSLVAVIDVPYPYNRKGHSVQRLSFTVIAG